MALNYHQQLAVFLSQPRATCLRSLETRLDRSTWGRGIYTQRFQVPGARPAQIRAGARKLYDRLRRELRHGL